MYTHAYTQTRKYLSESLALCWKFFCIHALPVHMSEQVYVKGFLAHVGSTWGSWWRSWRQLVALCLHFVAIFFNIASRCANIEPRFVKVYLRSHLGANILQNVSQIPLPSTPKSQKTIKNYLFLNVFLDPAFVLKCAEITPYKPPRPHKMSSRWSSWRQLGPRSLQVEAS